jgi:lysophospholipase L1-like esterase
MRIIKYNIINFCLLFASLLFCFSIGEIFLRLHYNKQHKQLVLKYKDRDLCITTSNTPGLIYEYIPNKCANSHGYFDYEYTYIKNDNIFRIVIIGDSIAEGQGVKLKESFGKVLEAKLNSYLESKKCKVEVIVLARTGYSTSQELIIFKNEAFRYNPDLIIWSYALNDPAHPVYRGANGELGLYFFKPKSYLAYFIMKKIYLINEKIKGRHCDKEYHKFLHCAHWKQVIKMFYKIRHISEEKHIAVPIIFLIHPVLENFNNYSFISLHEKLRDIANKSGLVAMDLLEAYKPFTPDELKHDINDPWHPNAKGHLITADYIFDKITKGDFIEN